MPRDPAALAAFADADLERRGVREAERSIRQDVERGMGKAETFRAAMDLGRRVAFDYTRKFDGATVHYLGAPYSRRGNKLYATEGWHGDDKIHSFLYHRIRNWEMRPRLTFDPRWPTEPESA